MTALPTSCATSLSVLVPVYNEQYLVTASLERLKVLAGSPLLERVQIIVVDDCSRDQTAAVLSAYRESKQHAESEKLEWHFVRHERNLGKGGAIRSALELAECELSVIHDADLEYHPRDLLRFIPLFLDEQADAVFGSRFLPGEFKRALFFRHSMGNRFLTFVCNLACDLDLSDMETCYKMARTELLRSLPLESNDFRIEPELTIKLAKRGARIYEVPISYSGRTYQEGKKISWRDGVKALWAIARFRLSDNIFKPDPYGSQLTPRLRRAPRYSAWLAGAIRPYLGERVLELGAGVGTLTLSLIPRRVYWASDPNPLFVRELDKLDDTRPYLRSARVDAGNPSSFPAGERFDTVVAQNVLEHAADDYAALCNLAAVLDSGGRAIVLAPNGRGLFGSLDRVLGHVRRYTRADLESLAAKAGLRVVAILPFNRAGSSAWWINARLLRRNRFSLLQIKLLNFLVPVLRRLDGVLPLPPLTWIAVLEKPVASTADSPRDVASPLVAEKSS